MLTLPIPIIVSLALAFMLAIILITRSRPWPVVMLLAICIQQGILISLVQYYGFVQLFPLQPIGASLVPPATWLAYVATTQRSLKTADIGHALAPLFMAFCVAFAPMTIDFVMFMMCVGYALAIIVRLRREPDMPLVRLGAGDWPAYVWQAVAIALIASAFSDAMIALLMLSGYSWTKPIIVSIGSSLSLLLVGALTLSRQLDSDDAEKANIPAEKSGDPTEEDRLIVSRLDQFLKQQGTYRDPNMTLAKLARKMGLPAKQLSNAINRVTGDNVSRHINRFRIEEACDMLNSGQAVTDVMFSCGFNTKSNFNREFLRVTGSTPSSWRAARQIKQ